jgi:hypothetical protein
MPLSTVFAAASLLLCGFSFIYLLGYLRRRTGAQRILEDFEEEVNKLIAGIDAATDRNITLLEDRSATLKSMLETLDRRLAAYARELERREKQETALNALSPKSGFRETPVSQGAQTENAYAALGRGLRSTLQVNSPESSGPSPVAPPGAADPSGPAGPEPEEAPAQPRFTRSANPVKPKVPLAEQAQELYRNGFSPETIAVRLNATLAEINLALALSEPPADP